MSQLSTPVPAPCGLLAPTPATWFDVACERLDDLLIDHANCEKKAASTALALMFTYADDLPLAARMSRLAREELRHFEQMLALMRKLEVPWQRLSPSRYAEQLRRALRRREPDRLVDLLLCGALIEARSCERFLGLATRLPEGVAAFYGGLAASEARHHAVYLRLAAERAGGADTVLYTSGAERLGALEAELATSPDPQFRFHSGPPPAS